MSTRVNRRPRSDSFASRAKALLHILDTIGRVAPSRLPILFLGGRGTGIELLARAVHVASPRSSKPFVIARAGLYPRSVLEKKLVGRPDEPPSPTQPTLIASASGGTLFLDQIQNTNQTLQVELMKLLQERAGQDAAGWSAGTDVRLIASTANDLEPLVNTGQFRADLYYRLAVVPVTVPKPLSTREAILEVIEHLRGRIVRGPNVADEAEEAVSPPEALALEDVLRQVLGDSHSPATAEALLFAAVHAFGPDTREAMTRRHLEAVSNVAYECVDAYPFFGGRLYDTLVAQFQRALIERVLKQCNGIRARAANVLGISLSALEQKLREVGLDDRGADAGARLRLH